MTTIEERANKFVGHPFEADEMNDITSIRNAYVKGAKDQQQIDIERACDAIYGLIPMGAQFINIDLKGYIIKTIKGEME